MVSQLFIRVVKRGCGVGVVIVDHYYMAVRTQLTKGTNDMCQPYMDLRGVDTAKNCGPFGSVKAVRELVRAAR